VDTHSRPSSARALIGQIRGLTDKPVRYAVNTHFHWDHAQGNQAYPAAFPREVAIVSSEATREILRTEGLVRVKQQLEQGPSQIAARRERIAAEKDPAARARLEDEVRQHEAYLGELRSLELVLPDLTFDKSLILHRPERDIVLLFLGRGHTSGDVVTYLPKEKVVATGDLLHGWMPFMGDGYAAEWILTLDQLGKLDFEWIIGGHGDVKPRAHLAAFRSYLADLIEETRRARGRGEALDQAKTSVAAALRPRHAETMGGGERFDGSIGANVEKVYRDLEAGSYP
jgi:cyclase